MQVLFIIDLSQQPLIHLLRDVRVLDVQKDVTISKLDSLGWLLVEVNFERDQFCIMNPEVLMVLNSVPAGSELGVKLQEFGKEFEATD